MCAVTMQRGAACSRRMSQTKGKEDTERTAKDVHMQGINMKLRSCRSCKGVLNVGS